MKGPQRSVSKRKTRLDE